MGPLEQVRAFLAAELPPDCRHALVACSGGGDSVALAALAAEADPELELTLAHLDHGLREGSAAEADFVRELGARLGRDVRCETLTLVLSGNLAATARRARYEALARIAAETGAGAVLTGHTQDDRAETFWLWLMRGTGPSGLAPLPASRPLLPGGEVRLLRPLIDCRREALRDWLHERGLPWLEDPSNADLDKRRNRVRHRLLPFIAEEFDLDPTATTARLARRQGELLEYLDGRLAEAGLDPRAVRNPRAALAALDRGLRRHFAERMAGNHEGAGRLCALIALAKSGARADLGGGRRARLEADFLVLESDKATAPTDLPQVELPASGLELALAPGCHFEPLADWLLRVEAQPASAPPPAQGDLLAARFDLDALALPLRLANPRPGLRVRPLGGPGERKLADVFIDRKVPRPYRAAWPLVLDARDRLLWAPGLVRSELALLEPETRRSLCLDLRPLTS